MDLFLSPSASLLGYIFPFLQFNVERCHFLVDLDLPVATEMEPRYTQDKETWKIIAKFPFLDAAR